jgi:hypothetical protein
MEGPLHEDQGFSIAHQLRLKSNNLGPDGYGRMRMGDR